MSALLIIYITTSLSILLLTILAFCVVERQHQKAVKKIEEEYFNYRPKSFKDMGY